MKKLKHSKVKNTGLIFEILTRMAMKETLNPNSTQSAIKLIKFNFKPDSELVKELNLYQTLNVRSEHDSKELLNFTLEAKKSINQKKLLVEKYNLVKSIKKNYNIDLFFNTRVSNYTLTAAIYKLLEFNGKDNPEDYLNSKKLVVEHLSGKKEEVIEEEVIQAFREQDEDVRKIGFKMIIEKFNSKYRTLNDKQKKLLSKYINEDSELEPFKNYVLKEVSSIVRTLTNAAKTVSDDVTRIKLNETINLTQSIISAKVIKEEHLSSMLKFYELIEVLENE
jgi:hypothetical protein